MWWLILAFIAFVLLFTLVMYFLTRWSTGFVERQITERLEAIDQIVNEEQVPNVWLATYRQQARKLEEGGATQAQIHALSGVARKRCLANIHELIRFVESRKLTDTEATQQLMLRSLREQALRWEDEAIWHELVDLTIVVSEGASGEEH